MNTFIFKKALPVSLLAAAGLILTPAAQAMSFKASGQIDRALTYANNGKQSDIASVDNNGSNSRFRFTGSQDMSNGIKVGFHYEIGLTQLPSSSWDIGQNSNGSVQLDTRIVDAFMQGEFGTLSFGKGNGAAYYANTMDLSGTNFIGGGVWYELYSAGITFVDSAGQSIATIGKVMSPFNAIGRQNRVRYDSPSFGGLVLSGSYDNGGASELAARYKANLGDGAKFIAGASWVNTGNQGITTDPGTGIVTGGSTDYTRLKIYNGAASLLLANGLNFTVSMGHQETNKVTSQGTYSQKGYNATNYFGQVGYIVGQNHFVVNYGQTKDMMYKGVKGSQIGAAYVYNWTNAIQLYASYHNYKLNLPSYVKTGMGVGNAQDINQLFIGTRIKFM